MDFSNEQNANGDAASAIYGLLTHGQFLARIGS
jgi:hypothetical protein